MINRLNIRDTMYRLGHSQDIDYVMGRTKESEQRELKDRRGLSHSE